MNDYDDYREQATDHVVRMFDPNDPKKRLTAIGILEDFTDTVAVHIEDPLLALAIAERLRDLSEELFEREQSAVNRVFDQMKATGARTIGELVEMQQKRPKLSLVEGDAG